ncbi:Bug family tripartite tricarboxylate transporter substrate binding protein [Verticiella sediminum]|nr:tripartite tricarboxylate transporter substrate binding protein [Verticiella sediminum]
MSQAFRQTACRPGMRRIVLGALCALALAPAAHAAEFASQPVRLVVGTAAGGAVDTYARVVAEALSREIGQTVLVENKSGANGNIAAQYVIQQPADGNTLWIGTQAMVEINPVAFKQMPWKAEDFVPIIKGVEAPLVLATHPSVPARSLQELIGWARAHPGTGYASFSPGTPSQFLGYQLSESNQLDMVHVPYRGSAPQVADMVGGHALVGFTQIQTSLPLIQDGKLNAIATTSAQRSRFLPDTPTLDELGMPELQTTVWFGVMAPARIPADTRERLEQALVAVHRDPVVIKRLEDTGYDVSGQTGEPFAQAVADSRQRWAGLVKATGFAPED